MSPYNTFCAEVGMLVVTVKIQHAFPIEQSQHSTRNITVVRKCNWSLFSFFRAKSSEMIYRNGDAEQPIVPPHGMRNKLRVSIHT